MWPSWRIFGDRLINQLHKAADIRAFNKLFHITVVDLVK